MKKSSIRNDFMNVKEYLNDKIREANKNVIPYTESPISRENGFLHSHGKVLVHKPVDSSFSPMSNRQF